MRLVSSATECKNLHLMCVSRVSSYPQICRRTDLAEADSASTHEQDSTELSVTGIRDADKLQQRHRLITKRRRASVVVRHNPQRDAPTTVPDVLLVAVQPNAICGRFASTALRWVLVQVGSAYISSIRGFTVHQSALAGETFLDCLSM